jgi:hypothetical protein
MRDADDETTIVGCLEVREGGKDIEEDVIE